MTDRAIIVIAIFAFLAVCVICGTILLLQRGKNKRNQDNNNTYKSMLNSMVKSDNSYSFNYGELYSERNADKKSITFRGKETETQSAITIGAKIVEFITHFLKREK